MGCSCWLNIWSPGQATHSRSTISLANYTEKLILSRRWFSLTVLLKFEQGFTRLDPTRPDLPLSKNPKLTWPSLASDTRPSSQLCLFIIRRCLLSGNQTCNWSVTCPFANAVCLWPWFFIAEKKKPYPFSLKCKREEREGRMMLMRAMRESLNLKRSILMTGRGISQGNTAFHRDLTRAMWVLHWKCVSGSSNQRKPDLPNRGSYLEAMHTTGNVFFCHRIS